MEYVVYCDESRHEGQQHDQYMAIGSIWVPKSSKHKLNRKFRSICASGGINAEVKWQKTSNVCLDTYKALVDFFYSEDEINFRAIVVDKTKVDLEKYHNGDSELGFYKFYYEMLIKWVEHGNSYVILIDFKKNRDNKRHVNLKNVLVNAAKYFADIKELTIIDSEDNPLAQLCDLLTGAVAASYCKGLRAKSPKSELSEYIAERGGFESLTFVSPRPEISKFNLFKIKL